MKWIPARLRRAHEARDALVGDVAGRPSAAPRPSSGGVSLSRDDPRAWRRAALDLGARRARSLCVVSGKGGTGKSLVCASLAASFARQSRTLVLDADLGVANAHILQDVTPERTLVEVVEGRAAAREVLARVGPNLSLLAGGSGFSRMAELTPYEQHLLALGIEELERELDWILVDSAAGLSSQTLSFALASDQVLLVTTPDLTAMTDAYAFLKVYARRGGRAPVALLVNRAADAGEAERTAQRIREVASKFLGHAPTPLGSLPEDRAAFRCGQRRQPVVLGEPESALAAGLERLSDRLRARARGLEPLGLGRRLLERTTPPCA